MVRCVPTISSTSNSILLVGEAPGEQEDLIGRVFIGSSGQELTRILADAGIKREDCHLTNVFLDRPKDNDLKHFQGGKKDGAIGLSQMSRGKYLLEEKSFELDRLRKEIAELQPNIIVALGATAAWALLGQCSLNSIRGTIREGLHGRKVLATWHPAFILRVWQERAICVADFMKVKRESLFPEIKRPSRTVLIEPTILDLLNSGARFHQADLLSVDVETRKGQITCCGFSDSKNFALVLPFTDNRKPDRSYWSFKDELFAYHWMKDILEGDAPKLFQNGLYDIQYFHRYGIRPKNCLHDTMLRHHAIQPEMKKGLGFLGSLYTNESPWKLMRANADTVKRDE